MSDFFVIGLLCACDQLKYLLQSRLLYKSILSEIYPVKLKNYFVFLNFGRIHFLICAKYVER